MKRKAIFLIFKVLPFFLLALLMLSFLLNSGCSPASKAEPESKPTGKVTIALDNLEQEYYKSLKEWSVVHIYYTIENKSSEIVYNYKIYFTVNCADDSVYHDSWHERYTISPDKSHSDEALLDTFGKQAKSVKITELAVNIK